MKWSKEYSTWRGMISRCHNPNEPSYIRYGARGIKVCARWRFSFDAFYADVGPAPSLKHTIDRIDNDAGYRPGNVRWATWSEQNKNKRSTRRARPIEDVLASRDRVIEQRKNRRRRVGFEYEEV